MIITLRNADFSSNNIGHIDIHIVLSSWSQAIVDKYSSFNWTDAKKTALQKFEDSLINAGVKEKLHYLALPILADNLNDAVFNNIQNSSVTATIGERSSSFYTITQGLGIARTAVVKNNGDVVNGLIHITANPALQFNHHILTYTPEDWPTPVTDYANVRARLGEWVYVDATSTATMVMGFQNFMYLCSPKHLWSIKEVQPASTFKTKRPPIFFNGSTNSFLGDVNFSYRGVPLLFTNNGTTCSMSIAEQDFVTAAAADKYQTGSAKTLPDYMLLSLYPIDIDGSMVSRRYSVLAYGESVTNAESKAYQKAVVDFVDVLRA